jgi:hypothetical protein
MIGNEACGKQMEGVRGLASSRDQVPMRHVLESLLQIKHDVDAVRAGAFKNSPNLVPPGGVARPSPSRIGAQRAFSMNGRPSGGRRTTSTAVEAVEASEESDGPQPSIPLGDEDYQQLGFSRGPTADGPIVHEKPKAVEAGRRQGSDRPWM